MIGIPSDNVQVFSLATMINNISNNFNNGDGVLTEWEVEHIMKHENSGCVSFAEWERKFIRPCGCCGVKKMFYEHYYESKETGKPICDDCSRNCCVSCGALLDAGGDEGFIVFCKECHNQN